MRNPIQLVRDSVSIIKDNPALFFGILLIPLLLSVIASVFEPVEGAGVVDTAEWLIFVGLTLITAIANIFMGIALVLALNNRSLSVKEAYSAAAPLFWPYLGLSILTSIIITVGFILLIIPGIIVSVWLAFSTIILVLERTGVVEAMKKSKEYVKGQWWGVFGRLLAISLIAFLLLGILLAIVGALPIALWTENMIMSFFSMLIAPVVVGYMYLLYQDLKGTPTVTASTSTNPITSSEVASSSPSSTSGV